MISFRSNRARARLHPERDRVNARSRKSVDNRAKSVDKRSTTRRGSAHPEGLALPMACRRPFSPVRCGPRQGWRVQRMAPRGHLWYIASPARPVELAAFLAQGFACGSLQPVFLSNGPSDIAVAVVVVDVRGLRVPRECSRHTRFLRSDSNATGPSTGSASPVGDRKALMRASRRVRENPDVAAEKA